MADLGPQGWVKFGFDRALADWADAANEASLLAEAAPPPDMLRCDGTWFVGVNALNNDGTGRLPGGPPLAGEAITAARTLVGRPFDLDHAQASVCYPGYPRQGVEEDDTAFRYRQIRHAAHVDGLHRMMPGRRRMLKERHAFILGIPLNDAPVGAAPFTVWEGSHEIMRAAFQTALGDVSPSDWDSVDLTEAYQAARRICFEECREVALPARRGEAYLVHRLALHGVKGWGAGNAGRRSIAYFRPDLVSKGIAGFGDDWWLTAP